MQINHCLIMSAGFGTRMGEVGKQLPKVLWPVFERSLLELQVLYAKSLGIESIYVNLHYQGEEIETFAKDKHAFEGVKFLWEKPEILDIGGAVHNLASQKDVNYKGNLLILNADQFFYLTVDELKQKFQAYANEAGVLFSYVVDSSLGYNALDIDADRIVTNITPNQETKTSKIETYTGISIVNLNKLTPQKGASKFFESVLNYKKVKVPAVSLENVDYWDFGTAQRYYQTCFQVLKTYSINSNHKFLRFLVTQRALKTWKIDLLKHSYHAESELTINLSENKLSSSIQKGIYLTTPDKSLEKKGIFWNGIVSEIK